MTLSCSKKIASNFTSDFYWLNSLQFFRIKTKLELHEKVCENKDFCNVNMPYEDTKILKLHQYQKSHKARFIIYAGRECIKEKIDGCINNPENSSTTKV